MLRGLEAAASGMLAQQRRQEALSNNLANVDTAGYKKDDTAQRAFPELLIERIQYGQRDSGIAGIPGSGGISTPLGSLYNGVYTQELIPQFQQGTLQETGRSLDIAIDDQNIPFGTQGGKQLKPSVFFAVQTPDGQIRYTRNGKWDRSADGQLITSDGYLVLDAQGQPIRLPDDDFKILSDGQILTHPGDPASTAGLGRIGVVLAGDPKQLVREGNNAYRWTGPNPLPYVQQPEAAGIRLKQGFVESSNVDSAQTMADMMMTMRSYEANQKVIQAYDRTMELLNRVGSLNG